MGFLRLLIKSIVYPTLLILAFLVSFVIYVAFFKGEEPKDSWWNHQKKIHLPADSHFTRVKTNGVTLNVLEAGRRGSELVVFLHGFPETALLSWHNQIQFFVDKGYHVIAPDQRGYNTSDKPLDLSGYWIDNLVVDIVGLIDHYGVKRANIIGHDWGGAVAWKLAENYPERVKKLAVLNIPHPTVFKNFLKANLKQASMSWYMFYFQLPWIPEWALSKNNYSGVRSAIGSSSIKGHTFSSDAIPLYVQGWSEPGALTGMLNWYRAAIQLGGGLLKSSVDEVIRIKPRTSMLFGLNDVAIHQEAIPLSAKICDNGTVHFFPDATHWLQHDEPERVNQMLLRFLKE